MNKELYSLDFAKLGLESELQEILSQLLNHIEVLTTELNQVKEERQSLRDEIARLKGGKGKPDIKANRTDNEEEDGADDEEEDKKKAKKRKHGSGKNSKNHKPRNERITLDREETVSLDRSELPDDVKVQG